MDVAPTGELVVFDGASLVLIDPAGVTTPLFAPPPGGFGELVRVEPGGATALLAVSPSYDLYRVDLVTGAAVIVANLPYVFDTIFAPSGDLFAVLGDATFSMTTLERLDLAGGSRELVANLPGATGPLAALPSGDLVYGTNDFGRASQALLVFSAAQILGVLSGGPVLADTDATELITGLAGTSGLVREPGGNLLLVENDFSASSSRLVAVSPLGVSTPIATAPAGAFLGRMGISASLSPFTAGGAPGPRVGVLMSDFFSFNAVLGLEPSRPGGPVFGDCDLDDQVDVVDALLAARSGVGLTALAGLARAQCDVDGGGAVDVLDSLAIAQFAAGLPVVLGY